MYQFGKKENSNHEIINFLIFKCSKGLIDYREFLVSFKSILLHTLNIFFYKTKQTKRLVMESLVEEQCKINLRLLLLFMITTMLVINGANFRANKLSLFY